jgi:hypothetical protein
VLLMLRMKDELAYLPIPIAGKSEIDDLASQFSATFAKSNTTK